MNNRLELLINDDIADTIGSFSDSCKCTMSDVARAALKLGLKQLSEQGGITGLSTKSWIAALNGKIK